MRKLITAFIIVSFFFGMVHPVRAAIVCTNQTSSGGSSADASIGRTDVNDQTEVQRFTVTSECVVTDVQLIVRWTSAMPSDSIQANIYTDVAGVPGLLIVSSTARPGSDFTSSYANYVFSFSGSNTLHTGTTYWVGLTRTGSLSNANFWQIRINNPPIAAGTSFFCGATGSTLAICANDTPFGFDQVIIDGNAPTTFTGALWSFFPW